jgi:prepilin-type N-terminal cleavage/methylation domain-containing protein/prepilin-type processing-associated H-X9-DG protein
MLFANVGASDRRGSAFTLIEILVVISVIGILAAILFPVFAHVREKGRQTTCLSNLKQLGMGTLLYVQDYDERIYPYGYGLGYQYTWEYYTDFNADHPNDYSRGFLYPYVKDARVFTCPDAIGFEGTVGSNTGSYGLNTYLSVRINGTDTTGIDLSTAQAHAQTILIADTAQVSLGKLRGYDIIDPPSEGGGAVGAVHGRHNRMADVVWLDGHVNVMKPACGMITPMGCLLESFDLGTLMRGAYTGKPLEDDYYWERIKPD